MVIAQEDMKVLLKSQQGELDAALMHRALAGAVEDETDAEAFRLLAADEGRHAGVFKGLTHQALKLRNTLASVMPAMYRLLGKRRLYPMIARGEYDAARTYQPIAEKFPEIESVKDDEKRHGDIVAGLLADDALEKEDEKDAVKETHMKNMDKLACCALGFVAASTIACLVVHRRVVAALVKGEPMPEPPASHKGWHPRLK